MKLPHVVCALALFTGSGFLSAQEVAPAKKHLLRYAFEEGKTAYAVMSQHMNMTMEMAGQSIATVMDMELHASQTVASLKEGKARIQTTYDRIVVKAKNPGMDIDYDSAVEGSSPGVLAPIAQIAGKRMDCELDTSGKISAIVMPDELKGTVKQALDLEQFSKKQFQSLPESPVAVGDTWDTEVEMNVAQGGTSKIKVKNKLAEVADGKARIDQEMQFDLGALGLPEGAKMELEKARGSMTIDLVHWQVPAVNMDLVMATKSDQMNLRIEISMVTKAGEAPKPKAGEKESTSGGGK